MTKQKKRDALSIGFRPTRARVANVSQGDIRRLEGTRAIVHAKANQPVNSAWIEFDPNETRNHRAVTLSVKSQGNEANGTFLLARLKDGSPQHSTYQIRLTSEGGLENHPPRCTVLSRSPI